MGNRYSFTPDALHNIKIYGIEPGDVWQVLHAKRRLTRHIGDEASAVFGATNKFRHLVVFVTESGYDDNDWDVIAAREMFPDEIATFDRYTGGQR